MIDQNVTIKLVEHMMSSKALESLLETLKILFSQEYHKDHIHNSLLKCYKRAYPERYAFVSIYHDESHFKKIKMKAYSPHALFSITMADG